MLKDLNKDAYGKNEAPSDMNLANRDVEIMIGQDEDGDKALD